MENKRTVLQLRISPELKRKGEIVAKLKDLSLSGLIKEQLQYAYDMVTPEQLKSITNTSNPSPEIAAMVRKNKEV